MSRRSQQVSGTTRWYRLKTQEERVTAGITHFMKLQKKHGWSNYVLLSTTISAMLHWIPTTPKAKKDMHKDKYRRIRKKFLRAASSGKVRAGLEHAIYSAMQPYKGTGKKRVTRRSKSPTRATSPTRAKSPTRSRSKSPTK